MELKWRKVILEKLTVTQLVKIFPAFHGTHRFITVFITTHHWSLPWAKCSQSTPSHPISVRSIIILSSHIRLNLLSGLFPSRFPTKNSVCIPQYSQQTTVPALHPTGWRINSGRINQQQICNRKFRDMNGQRV